MRKRLLNGVKRMAFAGCALLALFQGQALKAQAYETIPTGSFVVDMGGTQSISTLKAYGMLYNLMKGAQVPVKWCINPSKAKDGVDFTIQGTVFKSGAFVITKPYRTTAVNSIISTWVGKGVSGITTTSDVSLPVYRTLLNIPRWSFLLDLQNGSVAKPYLTNAEIPDSSVTFIDPKLLTCCHDLYIMPHADPVWSTHSKLFTWTKSTASGGCRGSIWAACHAVSALENMVNPSNLSEQTNFLANKTGTAAGSSSGYANPKNALLFYTDHTQGTVPYSYRFPTDPMMQFLGILDGAVQNGSEQIYMPVVGGSWRSSTKIGVWDPDHPNAGSAPREATVLAWGFAMGDTSAGMVMYEGGHRHNPSKGTPTADQIAGQRAFFNFSLASAFGGSATSNNTNAIRVARQSISSNRVLKNGTLNFGIKIAGGSGSYTFRWTSACGGTLSASTVGSDSARLIYTAPNVASNTDCYVSVIARDGCGREAFYSWTFQISSAGSNSAPVVANESVSISGSCSGVASAGLNVLSNDSDPENQVLSASLLSVKFGKATLSSDGELYYEAPLGFSSYDTIRYRVCDNNGTPACTNGFVAVTVGSRDSKGCWGSEFWDMIADENGDTLLAGAQDGLGTAGGAAVNDPENALGPPDGTGCQFDNTLDTMVLGLKNLALGTLGDTIYVTWKPIGKTTGGAGNATLNVDISANGTTWTNRLSKTRTTATLGTFYTDTVVVTVANTRWARIRFTSGVALRTPEIDGILAEQHGCRAKTPTPVNDVVSVIEDRTARIDVRSNDITVGSLKDSIFRISTYPKRGLVCINLDQSLSYEPNRDNRTADTFFYEVINNIGATATARVIVNMIADGCAANQYAGTATSASVSLTPVRDAYIYQKSTGTNYGTNAALNVGSGSNGSSEYRSVLYWNLSSIATTAKITKAEMQLYRNGGASSFSVDIQPIANGSASSKDSFSSAGVTWASRRSGVAWTTAGGDVNAQIIGTINTGLTTAVYVTSTSLVDTVQKWVSTPSANLGVRLKRTGAFSKNALAVFNSNNAAAATRPKLNISYTNISGCKSFDNTAPHPRVDLDTVTWPAVKVRNVVTNDRDLENNTLTLTGIHQTIGGTATRSGNNITFTPSRGFNGWATVLYIISDGALQDTGYYRILCLNGAPTAVKDSATIAVPGGNVTVAVQSNDSDPEGAALTTRIVRQGSKGVASLSGSSIRYDSYAGQTGVDTVYYSVTEPNSGSCSSPKSATSILVVRILNRKPKANRDVASTNTCQERLVDVMFNDTDPDGNSIVSVAVLGTPLNGTATVSSGKILYTPRRTPTPFSGADSFRYVITDNGFPAAKDTGWVRVNVAASGSNSKPIAGDDSIVAGQNNLWFDYLMNNDSDPDGDDIVPFISSGILKAKKGTVQFLSNGLLKYVPNAGFVGKDSFEYIIKDTFNTGPCASPAVKYDTAKVIVIFSFTQKPATYNSVVAVDDFNKTLINTNVTGNVIRNDFDPERNTISFVGFLNQSGNGSRISSGATLSGKDKDGNAVANAGTLTFTGAAYTYAPKLNFSGTVIVPYCIRDNASDTARDTAMLNIYVKPLDNNNNVLASIDFNVSYGDTVKASLFANDYDPERNTFVVTRVKRDTTGDLITDQYVSVGSTFQTSGQDFTGKAVKDAGRVKVNADGTYKFFPTYFNGDYFKGTINVDYVIEDDPNTTTLAGPMMRPAGMSTNAGSSAKDSTALIIVVLGTTAGVNSAPYAGDDFSYTIVDEPVTGSWSVNDLEPDKNDIRINGIATNIDLDTLAVTPTLLDTKSTLQGGTVKFYNNGTYLYTPPTAYVGPDEVTYQICDVTAVTPQPLCANATINLLVGTLNSTVAANDINNTWMNTTVTGNVCTNDLDIEGHTQTFGSFLNQDGSGTQLVSPASVSGLNHSGGTVSPAGTLTFTGCGYTFVPTPGFTGTVTIPYNVCDDGTPGACDTGYLTISVDSMYSWSPNNVIANNDFMLSLGGAVSSTVVSNDKDPEGNTFTVTSYRRDTNGDGVVDAAGTLGSSTIIGGTASDGTKWANAGTLTLNSNGTYTYTPAVGFYGAVSIEYTITDNGSPVATDKAMLEIMVEQPNGSLNDPPFAGDDFSFTTLNKSVSGNWYSNDVELNGDSVRLNPGTTSTFLYMKLTGIHATATPIDTLTTLQGGSIIFFRNGTYRYTPPTGFVGTDRIAYSIADKTTFSPQPLTATAVVYLLVGTENATVAVGDFNNTWLNNPVSGNVKTNDYDPEGNTQTFGSFLNQSGTGATIASGATLSGTSMTGGAVANAGTLTFTGTGSYTFTPTSTFTGTVRVPYNVCDNGNPAACDTAFLTISVDSLASAAYNNVIANDDNMVSYGETVTSKVTSNDSDPDGNSFTVTSYRYDSDGNGTVDANGTVGSSVAVGGLAYNGVKFANAGSLTLNANGTYTFTPAAGFIGTVTVNYVISDNGTPVATDPAFLIINVLQTNGSGMNDAPFAGDDFSFTRPGVAVTGSWAANDREPNGDSIRINGKVVNLLLSALPGSATRIDSVTTTNVGKVVFLRNGNYIYTPPVGYTGPDAATYSICDVTATSPQPLCATATIYLLIGSENTTNAANDVNNTWMGKAVSGNVKSNDFDVESNTQTFGSFLNQNGSGATISSGATLGGTNKAGSPVANAGTLTFSGASYTFTPAAGFAGTVSVPYNICDNGSPAACDTGTLTISVDSIPSGIRNTLIATNDFAVSNGASITSSVVTNDKDPENNSFTVTAYSYDSDGNGTLDASGTVGSGVVVAGVSASGAAIANAGTLTLNANGGYTFVPASGFAGTVNVRYTITDNATVPTTDQANMLITVLADNGVLNDAPFAGDDFAITRTNTAVTGNWAGNDLELNGDSVNINGSTNYILLSGPNSTTTSMSTVATAQGGSVTFRQNGTYVYTPPNNYNGPDNVTYQICDKTAVTPQPLCATATLYLLIAPDTVSISGTVFNDFNGGTVNGTGRGTFSGQRLVAYLIDGGLVLDSTRVNADGTYSFDQGLMETVYTVRISATSRAIANTAPSATLPSNWTFVGENYGTNNAAGSGLDGTINGSVALTTQFSNVSGMNFGINYAPIAHSKTYLVNVDSLLVTGAIQGMFNRRISLNASSGKSDTTFNTGSSANLPGTLSGYDSEEGRLGGATGLDTLTLVLQTLPDTSVALLEYISNGTIYNLWPNPTGSMVRNALVFWNAGTGKYVIQNADLDSFRILLKTPLSATSFSYAFIDESGTQGSVGLYTLGFTAPLPVNLTQFGCSREGSGVAVNWITAGELNTNRFDVYRSTDGNKWEMIGSVKAAGNTAQTLRYKFIDNKPVVGLNAYRLLVVDQDNHEDWGPVCASQVTGAGREQVQLYPNPALNSTTLRYELAEGGAVKIGLMTVTGVTLRTINIQGKPGVNYYDLDISTLLPGSYMISVDGEILNERFRLIKQ